MTETRTGKLGEREVVIRPGNVGLGLEANDVQQERGDKYAGAFHILARSAVWADTGEPVFQTIDEVYNWPLTDGADIMALVALCGELNNRKPKPNGHAAEHAAPNP